MLELRSYLDCLSEPLNSARDSIDPEQLHKKIETGHCIRRCLLDVPDANSVKDRFRTQNGFQVLLNALRVVAVLQPETEPESVQQTLLSDYISVLFGILSAGLRDHKGNQRFFHNRVDGGGWKSLQVLLTGSMLPRDSLKATNPYCLYEHLCGCLLACAVDDETLVSFFFQLRRSSLGAQEESSSEPTSIVFPNGSPSGPEVLDIKEDAEKMGLLKKNINALTVVQHPEALSLIFELWRSVEARHRTEGGTNLAAADGVLVTIRYLANMSARNLSALHATSLLSNTLSCLVSTFPPSSNRKVVRSLALDLLQLGVSSVDDARLLYSTAASSPFMSQLLLEALKLSHFPPYIHFDLSVHGYSSIELPSIGRGFPPASSAGYTLTLWLYMVNFDASSHTTLFGAFDSSQSCFVLVYLEKDTHNLILQTSVSSSRPSVRFKAFAFQDKRWYHITIVHRRPKTTMSSRASLFVNGTFVEQLRSNYPAPPHPVSSGTAGKDNPRRLNPIQAFLGTPQDLATRIGKGLVFSEWRLASAHLIAEALSDDLIAVHYQLGPRYNGNYQDILGGFQTYEASAALNIRNESLHPGREETSDIIIAIRSKASALVPESQTLLNFSPYGVLCDDESERKQGRTFKGLGKQAFKNLQRMTRGQNPLVINGAMPNINKALQHTSGFAVLTGDPVVVQSQALDDAAWRIGGCAAVGLSLVEAAKTGADLNIAVRILLESIKDSWRNSEAMERENGFGVLATLLAKKLDPNRGTLLNGDHQGSASDDQEDYGKLSLSILSDILAFVGYNAESPRDSAINNPLAYRVLLIDLAVWRTAAPAVQRLYYNQFVVFGKDSKYHYFNSKRLSKMRIAKKWLDALKGETFIPDTFQHFMEAFRTILTPHPPADCLRYLALFVTYATHRPKRRSASLLTPTKSISKKDGASHRKQTPTNAPSSPANSNPGPCGLSCLQIAVKILEFYANLLCDGKDTSNIKRFARTVTNRWLLYLLASDNAAVVVHAAKMLARLLVVSGPNYMKKFAEKTGGIVIMQRLLRRWWNVPSIWPICFAVLFGQDVAVIDMGRNFDLFNLLEAFNVNLQIKVVYAEIFPVLAGMLQNGLRAITRDQTDPDSPINHRMEYEATPSLSSGPPSSPGPTQTMSKDKDSITFGDLIFGLFHEETLIESSQSHAFQDFAVSSSYVQHLLSVIFPIVVSSDVVSPETELHCRDSALTFDGSDVVIRPLSYTASSQPRVIRTTSAEQHLRVSRVQAPRRMSSYVLVSTSQWHDEPLVPKLQTPVSHSPAVSKVPLNGRNSIVEQLVEMVINVFSDQIFARKDFLGLGLFMKVPPGFQEHQAYFETLILRDTLSRLNQTIKLEQNLLCEPRVLTNLARFASHLSEAVYEGWFIDGVDTIFDFLGNILEYLQMPDVAKIKSIRLCNQTIAGMRAVLLRVVLMKLSELDESASPSEAAAFLDKIVYWQSVVLVTQDGQDYYVKLLCYLLYTKLVGPEASVRMAAANLWRILLVQKPHYTSDVLHDALGSANSPLYCGFKKIMELDNETFLCWVHDHREELDGFIVKTLANEWDGFVAEENRRTQENSKARVNKRKERLKVWQAEELANEEILRRHDVSADHWSSNIYTSEHLRHQRAVQDQNDDHTFNLSTWNRMNQDLRHSSGLFENKSTLRWQLDQTEGRNRMRRRLIASKHVQLNLKRRGQQGHGDSRHRSSIGKRQAWAPNDPTTYSHHLEVPVHGGTAGHKSILGAVTPPEPAAEVLDNDEEFEFIEDPQDDFENYEDKNRKVMRTLRRGDQVKHVLNISRIIGLEACEGLLILGKDYLYLLDNLFQRSDGEIVNVWQAPKLERDPYVQMISGKETDKEGSSSINANQETRSWRWDDVLSISKRRFLFRDVAVEIFFGDGRSYLLTTSNPHLRDELHKDLREMAVSVAERASSPGQEDTWRIESIKSPEAELQTLGSRFSSVFAHSHANPATRRWAKGEISNFQYLMLINTMAGRTFNDLTQYPVFPWVLADYSSEELDLTDSRSFRDLSKPMGCQTPERQADFRERYQVFAEMANENQPPFHYGTHYSSAMIVTSYLIRLQPFVQSYLLLQGGSFDHPDRLFYSMEKAWLSASRENMTDVRELIPEFYYLPEFLINSNGYDFGLRQGDGGAIDNVVLPPWAKGDPKIFIAKHREALESEYVSKHLHHWIDLIFGHKQRGEAALEATNVFHYLSYHGAKDLETIDDPVERLATIGIIHNFGQTPYQIFQKNHPAREDKRHRIKRLDTCAESLTRLPFPVLESSERVASLQYSWKQERVICSGFSRQSIAPAFEKCMEWGYIDGSIRFYAEESGK
ncbi:MAG: hypothetical protein Q9191_001607, partial [Dirinaria sp. TL-2023a]